MLTARHIFLSGVALAMLSTSGAALAKKTPKTPAPAATPAPTPAPVADATPTRPPLAPQAITVYPAYQITVKHQYPATGPDAGKPYFQGNVARVTASVQYDSTAQTYTVRDTGNASATSSFGTGQVTSANADFTNYSKVVGGATQTLTVSNVGSTPVPAVELSYVQYGHWRTVSPGTGNFGYTAQNDTYFVFGPKTTQANLPGGTANYATYIDGTYVNRDRSYDVDGTGNFSVNFANNTLTFDATMTGTGGPGLNFGTLNGSGTVTSKSSSFQGTGSNPTYNMTIAGYFFGPAANELGAVFQLKGPNGGNGDGAIVGSQP